MNSLGLSFLLGLPLLGSGLILLIPNQSKRLFYYLTIACLTLTFGLGILLLAPALQNPDLLSAQTPFLAERADWFSLSISETSRLEVQYLVGLDGLNTALLLLSLLILWLGAIASNEIRKHHKAYFALYLLLSAAVIGTFIALDFFLFYLCFEFMLLPMYFLVGIWGGIKREYAAIKFFMYTLLGSVLILVVGIALALGTDLNGTHT
ncbi:MAG: proton-conducting transporter membrane subunit, partial [Bacteroidota bacterium]